MSKVFDGEIVFFELEKQKDGRVRVVKVHGTEQDFEMPCFVCGVRKPVTEMWGFVEVGELGMCQFCSEECYLTFMLGRRDDAGNRVEAEGLHVHV